MLIILLLFDWSKLKTVFIFVAVNETDTPPLIIKVHCQFFALKNVILDSQFELWFSNLFWHMPSVKVLGLLQGFMQ